MTTAVPSQKPNNSEDDFAKLTTLIKDIKFSMLTTVAPDGTLQSRPMTTQNKTFDGTLWFFAGLSNSFIENLDGQREVNVSYAKPGDMEFVSVSGTASVSLARAKMQELWNDIYKAWFPQGLDDPNLCLLRVEVSSAEYWDTPSGKVVQLLGFLKAIATGEQAHPVGHGHIDLPTATPNETRVAGFEPESNEDPTPEPRAKTKTAW